jgi:hypothetical protein
LAAALAVTTEEVRQERIDLILRTGGQLVDLVRSEYPKPISRDAPSYRIALHGLVARATGTMETILHVLELRREADLFVLIRSLYDHVAMLGWIASDPEPNYALWKAEDARQCIKAHEEWKRDLGEELLEPAQLAEFQRLADEHHPGPTDLLSRARAADTHWKPRLGLEDKATFVGAYQLLFRSGSTRTHSTLQGLNDVIEHTPDHVVVQLESTLGEQALGSRAVVIYALGLRVSAEANGFPRIADIEAAMAEYLRRRR